MRLVADSSEDFKKLSMVQRLMTEAFKAEKGTGSELETAYKTFINTTIEKSYERPGEAIKKANITQMDTDERGLIIPYIVHAAINKKKIAVEYKDGKGNVSKRILEPFGWRNGQLSAFCHERGAWRTFKPSNILRIAITDDSFEMDGDMTIVAEDSKAMSHLVPSM